MARASAEASAMSRHGQSACVLMLDLDRFKAINDVHGHAVGDSVLVAVANAIQTQLRGADVLARWGGEEFIVLLPSTSPIDALGVAERVRAALPALTQPHWPADVRTSTSIGLTAWASGQDIDHAIRQADTALYRAKAEGRNRVCQAPPVA
jgi:diguanylate cyclase (GGDEF)-like protein